MKCCSKCMREKPVSEFSFIQKTQSYFNWCKECKNADLQQWRLDNPRPLSVEPVVYRITNNVNGKVYVGVTHRPFSLRKAEHINLSKSGSRFPIHAAIRKYGVDSFAFDVLERFSDVAQLESAEQRYVAQLKSMVPHGYNRTEGGSGMCGLRHSDEARHNHSILMRQKHADGYRLSPEARENIRAANIGRKMPREAVERSRAKRIGAKRTEEQRARISASRIGKGLCNQGSRVYPIEIVKMARYLLRNGVKQTGVVEISGLSQSYVSNLSTGKRGRFKGE